MRAMSKFCLMDMEAAFSLLSRYHIPVAPYVSIRSSKDLSRVKIDFEFPVVVKIISSKVIHKSESGGVRIVRDIGSLMKVLEELEDVFGDKLNGFLIQKLIDRGIELSIGGVRDPVFGPLVMFGSGGVFVELYEDISFRLSPINETEAVELIKETKAYKLLRGFRGLPNIDIYQIANLIIKVSKLIWDNKNISELDINPLIVSESFGCAVDVRVIVKEDEAT